MLMTPEDLVNVPDAIAMLRPLVRSRQAIYRLIESGRLDGRKINGTYWITRDSITNYLTEGEP